ncbi:MAG: hypothetical protein EAZ42_00900 [Verrucomicrobia bacterium]|nr:MAG: hypothetical protein EAZ42_00900 [Verrucomicrobiota bacterium]
MCDCKGASSLYLIVMNRFITLAASFGMAAAIARADSGPAKEPPSRAEWLQSSTHYQAGAPLLTALRIKMEKGWHTYWRNPGAGGMPLSIKWTLPPGWRAGEVQFPVPISFTTGELAGYGYEESVLLPIEIFPPANAKGDAEVSASFSWLTCNDDQCLPGKADLTLRWKIGDDQQTADHQEMIAAWHAIPEMVAEAILELSPADKNSWQLRLKLPEGIACDPNTSDFFPATPDVIAAGAAIQFSREGEWWLAKVPRSDYADAAPKLLDLVIAGKGTPNPIWVTTQPSR